MENGDTLLVWTHEYPGYGNGRGLTAKATASEVRPGGEGMIANLSQVELLTPHYSHREAQAFPSDSEVINYLRSMRLLRSYELDDEELRDLWSEIERFREAKATVLATTRFKSDEDRALDLDREAIEAAYQRRFMPQEIRPEQGAFRASLMSLYNDRCVISGCRVPEVLQAAHIVPFSEAVAYRNDPGNGLLLRSDIHTLFDRFLITIHPKESKVVIADELTTTSYNSLAGKLINHKAKEAFVREHYTRFREIRVAAGKSVPT